MTNPDVSLLAKLRQIVGTSVPVQQNYASTDRVQPRIWVQRQTDNSDTFLSSAESMIREIVYAVEVNALDPDEGFAISDLIQGSATNGGMHGHRGMTFGTMILGCWAENASDDYQPRGLDLDDGYHVFAFQLRMIV